MKEKRKRSESPARLRIVLVLGILVGVVILICINVVWTEPVPTEVVMSHSIQPIFYQYGDTDPDCRLHVNINTAAIWEPVPELVIDAVTDTLEITVDGDPVPNEYIEMSQPAILHVRVDDEGIPIGSYGGNIDVCFTAPTPLTPGRHTATMRFASNGGTIHSREWTFNVNETDGTLSSGHSMATDIGRLVGIGILTFFNVQTSD